MSVLKRRIAGGRDWKMTIQGVLESERSDLKKLRLLRTRLSSDRDGFEILMDLYEEKCGRLIELNELLHYRDAEKEESNTNGGTHGNAGG